jgi:FeS assembly SUF system protein
MEFDLKKLLKEQNHQESSGLKGQVIAALKTIYDPEIPVNIYDLGLIYGLDVDEHGIVNIQMTLTSPGCPVAQTFPGTVECAVKCVPGVAEAHVEIVWDPPWTKDRMSEAAKLQTGML